MTEINSNQINQMAREIAQKLDAKDAGGQNEQIEASIWNKFVNGEADENGNGQQVGNGEKSKINNQIDLPSAVNSIASYIKNKGTALVQQVLKSMGIDWTPSVEVEPGTQVSNDTPDNKTGGTKIFDGIKFTKTTKVRDSSVPGGYKFVDAEEHYNKCKQIVQKGQTNPEKDEAKQNYLNALKGMCEVECHLSGRYIGKPGHPEYFAGNPAEYKAEYEDVKKQLEDLVSQYTNKGETNNAKWAQHLLELWVNGKNVMDTTEQQYPDINEYITYEEAQQEVQNYEKREAERAKQETKPKERFKD